MCGIVGYTGPRQAADLLFEGLRRLEYRGYDSAGIALVADGRIEVHKAAGKIGVLEKQLGTTLPAGHTGIAHTRWATHGAPNTINAHPHTDCGGTLALIHNGITEIAVVRPAEYRILDVDSVEKEKAVTRVDWDLATIERGGHAHFMLKEIMEQPESLRDTLRGHLLEEEGTARLGGLNLTDEQLLQVNRIVFTACGTSWHSALIGEYMMEELARIPSEVEYASEFRYRNPIVDERTLVVGISQSGETADTLAALREAKRRGARTLGLVNVVGSTIAREVDGGIYLHAGPEIGVASTKAFTSQIAALAILTLKMGRLRALSILQGREVVRALGRRPGGRGRDRGRCRSRPAGRPQDRGPRDARSLDSGAHRAAAAAPGVLHRGAPGVQCRSAEEPGQVGHRGMKQLRIADCGLRIGGGISNPQSAIRNPQSGGAGQCAGSAAA